MLQGKKAYICSHALLGYGHPTLTEDEHVKQKYGNDTAFSSA